MQTYTNKYEIYGIKCNASITCKIKGERNLYQKRKEGDR